MPDSIDHAANSMKVRRTELDGVRAIAISMVLAFHCFRFPITGHSLLSYASRIPFGGWGGVDVFFALSGFLVGGILLDGRGQPKLLRIFLIRRAVRILPLYFVVLATFYITELLLTQSKWLYSGAAPWWSYVTLTQNFATPILGSDAFYLGPTWSLAVEAQIYLMLGFTLIRVRSRSVMPMMLAGIVLAELCRVAFLASGHGIFGYFVVPARIDGACCGVIAAMAVRSARGLDFLRKWRTQIWLMIMALFGGAEALSMIGQSIGSLGAGLYTHLALAVASSFAIALLISNPQGGINRMLRFKPLVWLGSVSYGVYLIHIPAIAISHAVIGRHNTILDSWSAAAASATGIVATICLAWLSFRHFETPLNNRAHRLTKSAPSANLFHKTELA